MTTISKSPAPVRPVIANEATGQQLDLEAAIFLAEAARYAEDIRRGRVMKLALSYNPARRRPRATDMSMGTIEVRLDLAQETRPLPDTDRLLDVGDLIGRVSDSKKDELSDSDAVSC